MAIEQGELGLRIDSYFSTIAGQYNFRYKYKWAKWQLEHITKVVRGAKNRKRILDFGTGPGVIALMLADLFPKSSVTGTDLSPGMLKEARKKAEEMSIGNISFLKMRTEKLHFPAGHFNIIVSNTSFHHVKNKEQALRSIRKILASDGMLVLSDWFEPSLEWKKKVRAKFPKEEIRKYRRSFSNYWKSYPKNVKKHKHPTDLRICQTELKQIALSAGYRKIKIIQSPHDGFAIMAAKKK